MRILFLAPYVPSPIRVRPYHFLRELAKRHAVTLLATDTARGMQAADALRGMCERVDVVPLRPMRALLSCARLALAGQPLQAAVCQSPALDARLRELLRDRSFDVTHVEHLRAARLGYLLPPGLPRLFDAVDSISLLLERTLWSSHSARQRALARLELGRTRDFERKIPRAFDGMTVTSADDAAAFAGLGNDPHTPITVVPNGVDLDAFRPVDEAREPATLVFSGKMSYHANVTAALHFANEIFPRVRADRPHTRFQIVGSDPPPDVRALGKRPGIDVTGYLPDLRTVVGRATVSVCPVTVKVGIQNKVLEAMALGVPVVATVAGASGLTATPERDLLVATSSADFARQVGRLLDDSVLQRTVGHAGRRFVEANHRWPDAVDRLETAYGAAIERRNLCEH